MKATFRKCGGLLARLNWKGVDENEFITVSCFEGEGVELSRIFDL